MSEPLVYKKLIFGALGSGGEEVQEKRYIYLRDMQDPWKGLTLSKMGLASVLMYLFLGLTSA